MKHAVLTVIMADHVTLEEASHQCRHFVSELACCIHTEQEEIYNYAPIHVLLFVSLDQSDDSIVVM